MTLSLLVPRNCTLKSLRPGLLNLLQDGTVGFVVCCLWSLFWFFLFSKCKGQLVYLRHCVHSNTHQLTSQHPFEGIVMVVPASMSTETTKTLELMEEHGIDNVRGGARGTTGR
jgi:hypothetical protein